ncbi:MAG TPA: hypothetical protein VMY42_27055 [Thermoguttaceae bacterium]|nr:hypothetical protein [Thermoguttaceae bacterium]
MPFTKNRISGFVPGHGGSGYPPVWGFGRLEDEMVASCELGRDPFDLPSSFEQPADTLQENWAQQLGAAIDQLAGVVAAKRKEYLRLVQLEQDINALKTRVSQLESSQSIIVPVTTLDPEPFQLLRDMQFVVRPTDDGYLATLFDANIGMTGDTREEAVANLKVLIVDIFDQLEQNEDKLGPEPARQIAVLRSFMRRRQ